MTDIERAAKQYSMDNATKDVSLRDAFEEGAYYILEKAKKWLKEPNNHENCSLYHLAKNFYEAMEG